MKKIIVVIVTALLLGAGLLFYQGYEKDMQNELYREAAVFFEEADYKKAIQYLTEAQEHNNLFSGSLNSEISYYIADSHLKLDEYEEAEAIYDELLLDEPKKALNYLLKGFCLSRAGKTEEAEALYRTGYEKTGDGEILVRLCNLYLSQEDYEAVNTMLEEVKSLKGDALKELEFLKIVALEKQQKYAEAYEEAVKFCDNYPEDERGMKEKTFLESRK